MSAQLDENLNICGALIAPDFNENQGIFQLITALWVFTIFLGLLAIGLTFHLCYKHFENYHKSQYQKWIVRILLMIPLYSICSSLSFRFYWYSIYFDIFRDSYEAFVIYSFYSLLLSYLGDNQDAQLQSLAGKPRMPYPFPFNCFTFNPSGRAFLENTKIMTLQYVIVRPSMSVLSFFLASLNVLCPTSMSFEHPGIYIYTINFISVTVAMYALIAFYLVIHHDIEHHNPFYKIVAVKAVVFATFWQSIILSTLESAGAIKDSTTWTSENLSALIQSFLVSVEMVVAAFLHNKAFSYREFVNEAAGKTDVVKSLWDAISLKDIATEIKDAPLQLKQQHRRKKERKFRQSLEALNGDAFADTIKMVDLNEQNRDWNSLEEDLDGEEF